MMHPRWRRILFWFWFWFWAAALGMTAQAQAEVTVAVAYLEIAQPRPPVLSGLDPRPGGLGHDGADLGLADNVTTGRFLGHAYTLDHFRVAEGTDPEPAIAAALAAADIVLLDASPAMLTAIADRPGAAGKILFNISSGDTALRSSDCRANLLHAIPSDAMRTDALAQFLLLRKWTDLVLISGVNPQDLAYAEALQRSLTKFGLKLRSRKDWRFDADMRRNAAQEVPLFTQEFGDYDALILADELHDFGRYVLYNTWVPRPVVGSEGLGALTWSPVVEQWGATQLQNRFHDLAGRDMTPEDYAAWAAIRTVGEAVTRTGSADPATLRAFILSDAFELAGFKGRPMTYRTWNGQLRQPIALVHPRALVAMAPLDGFLHRVNELDTLGLDAPESACAAFANG